MEENQEQTAAVSPNQATGSTIECGLFGITENHIQDYQSLDERFVSNPSATFFFEASGDSMAPNIKKGDVLVVDREITARHDHIIIAEISGQLTCKRLIIRNDHVTLRPDNDMHQDIQVPKDQELVVFGVVRANCRDLLNQA